MTAIRLAAATGDAVAVVDGLPDVPDIHVGLEGSGAQCVAIDPHAPDRMVAGTFDKGIFRSDDAGRTWQSLSDGIPHARVLSVAFSPCESSHNKSVLYAGTEPSSVYRSADDGRTWDDLASLRDLPSAPTWSFPPRPWTHHVRWIAPHNSLPDVLFVGIELGGVLRTLDGGRTWDDRHPGAVIDPHVLRTHAVATDRVYAVGGDGISYSSDAGESWRRDVDGMDRHYTWGLAVDPEDPDLWYASASTGPMQAHGEGDAQARLYRKSGSSAWKALRVNGFDGVDAPLETMPYALVAPRGLTGCIVAGMRDGALLLGRDAGDSWHTVGARLPGILALADASV
jgi:photosystem II stability/assembly factor-like uncharacterized protein